MNEEKPCCLEDDDILQICKDDNIYFKKCIPLVNFLETYQGEGPNCGKKMVLARYKYCNKLCPFCDTQHTTKNIIPTMYSLKDVDVLLQNSPNLMITGGEPTLFNKTTEKDELSQFVCTVMMAKMCNYNWLDVETNGMNLLKLVKYLNVISGSEMKNINISWSPKFISESDYEFNVKTLNEIINNENDFDNVKPIIKIVIGDDLDEYKRFIYDSVYKYGFDNNRIYLMPKGITLAEINESMKLVLQVASDLRCNVSSRLHVIHNFK